MREKTWARSRKAESPLITAVMACERRTRLRKRARCRPERGEPRHWKKPAFFEERLTIRDWSLQNEAGLESSWTQGSQVMPPLEATTTGHRSKIDRALSLIAAIIVVAIIMVVLYWSAVTQPCIGRSSRAGHFFDSSRKRAPGYRRLIIRRLN
jgi:hypothetical protein